MLGAFLFSLCWVASALPIVTEGVDQSRSPNYREHECPNIEYDAIVLGAGIGGLSTASTIAFYGKKKVLVLEHREVYGGGTAPMYYDVEVPPAPGQPKAPFKVPFQLGMHYLASVPDALAEWCLITGHEFEYHFVANPYDYYVDKFGEKIMDVNNFYDKKLDSNAKMAFYLSLEQLSMPDFVAGATAAYPDYAAGFTQFGKDFNKYIYDSEILEMENPPLLNYPMPTYMDEIFGPEPVAEGPKEMVTMYAEDLGVWSSAATFSSNAYMRKSILSRIRTQEGATGFHAKMADQIEEKEGCIQTFTHVDQIIIENGVAVGVEATLNLPGDPPKSQTFRSEHIISNMGIEETLKEPMLPQDVLHENHFDYLHKNGTYGVTVLGVNFAYNRTGDDLGFPKGLIHMYMNQTQGHDGYWAQPRPEVNNTEQFRLILFSFGSQRQDDIVGTNQVAYLTVMATVPFYWFDEWAGSDLENRPQSYHDWMQYVAVPRIRSAMYTEFPIAEDFEIAADMFSPLTIRDRYFMKNGAYCGTNPEWKVTYPQTTLPGLYIVGKDQKGCGVQLSAYSGLAAGLQILGYKFVDEIPYMPGFVPLYDYSVPGTGKKLYIPPLYCVVSWLTPGVIAAMVIGVVVLICLIFWAITIPILIVCIKKCRQPRLAGAPVAQELPDRPESTDEGPEEEEEYEEEEEEAAKSSSSSSSSSDD